MGRRRGTSVTVLTTLTAVVILLLILDALLVSQMNRNELRRAVEGQR